MRQGIGGVLEHYFGYPPFMKIVYGHLGFGFVLVPRVNKVAYVWREFHSANTYLSGVRRLFKKKKHLKAFCFSATRCLGSGARANLAAALIMKIDIQISRDQVPLRPQAAVWILRYEVLLAGVS